MPRTFRFAGCAVPTAALLLLVAHPAAAISFTIDPTSSLSGNIAAGFSVDVHTSLGTQSGSGMVSGSLGSTPTGGIATSPNLTLTQLDFTSADIDAANPGTASGDATLDVFGFIDLTLDVDIDIDNIALDLASATSSALTPMGGGVWSFTGNPNLLIGATAGGSAEGPLGIGFSVPSFSFGGSPPGIMAPITGTLEDLGAAGSKLAFSGSNLEISIPLSGKTENIPIDECIGGSTFLGCLGVNINSLDLTLDYIEFTDVNADIIATSSVQLPVPEPAMAALLLAGSGAVLVGAARRRRSTRGSGRSLH